MKTASSFRYGTHMSGHINKQTYSFGHLNNPVNIPSDYSVRKKVTVWSAVGKRGIIGTYLFEDNDESRVTVNSERYIELMRRTFVPALGRRGGVDINTVVFHQDGVPLIALIELFSTLGSTSLGSG